jgi:hypothetical protein
VSYYKKYKFLPQLSSIKLRRKWLFRQLLQASMRMMSGQLTGSLGLDHTATPAFRFPLQLQDRSMPGDISNTWKLMASR